MKKLSKSEGQILNEVRQANDQGALRGLSIGKVELQTYISKGITPAGYNRSVFELDATVKLFRAKRIEYVPFTPHLGSGWAISGHPIIEKAWGDQRPDR